MNTVKRKMGGLLDEEIKKINGLIDNLIENFKEFVAEEVKNHESKSLNNSNDLSDK
jgi:hypothetical protein